MPTTFEDDEAYALFLEMDTLARVHRGENETVNYLRERLLPVYRAWHKANPHQVHPGLTLPNSHPQTHSSGVKMATKGQGKAYAFILANVGLASGSLAILSSIPEKTMKQPNDDSLAEMLEGTRAALKQAVARIAKLEAEKSELANMVLIYAYRAEQAKNAAPSRS